MLQETVLVLLFRNPYKVLCYIPCLHVLRIHSTRITRYKQGILKPGISTSAPLGPAVLTPLPHRPPTTATEEGLSCPPRLFPRRSLPLRSEWLRGGTSPRQSRARAAPPLRRERSGQHRADFPGKHRPRRPGPATQDSCVLLQETHLRQSPKAEKILASRNPWWWQWPWERATQPSSCGTTN